MSSKGIKRNRSKSTMETVREELFRWLCKKQATNSFLDRHALREKALELTRTRGFNGFKCSEMWLTLFLKHHGFHSDQIIQGNPKFADFRDWIKLIRPTITKYRYKDVFHVDELVMYSDVPPSCCTSKEENNFEEPRRNRITVLMGCDASGTTKLPLLICGPYPSRITAKEHVYSHSEDSRIPDELFRNWLTSVDDRMVRYKRKILLFLKRSRARALEDFVASNVRLIYLPDNFPPHLRPLRRDVFHYVKMVLRRRYAELLKGTEEWGLHEILTSLIHAWETIPRELLIFSFQRTHFRIDDSFLQIDCDCWNNLKTGIAFKKFVTFDDRLSDEPWENNPCDEYKLRNIVQIQEDTMDSVIEDGRIVKSSSRLSIESDWDCRTIPAHVQSQYQLAGKSVTSDYEKPNSRRPRLTKYPIEEESGKQKTREKRNYRRQRSTKGRNSKTTESARKTGPSTSLKGSVFKENASQIHQEANEAQESLQAVMDKALYLLMSEKAKYVKNLIETIYTDTTENDNRTEQFKHLPISVDDTDPTATRLGNKDEDASFSANQLSISTVLTTEADQNELNITAENPISKITTVVEENQERDQSSCVDQNDESSLSFADDQTSCLSTKKRRRKSDSCENDYQNSEPRQKKSKTAVDDWSKKYETTFVFGSPDVNCSPTVQHGEGIIDSCVCNVPPRD